MRKEYRPFETFPQWPVSEAEPVLKMPEFPKGDMPVAELISSMSKRFAKRHEKHKSKQWFPIKVKDSKPFALAFVGDPHVDDDGCNWPLLERDIGLMRATEGVYAINIGDTTNNWVGRLIKKYADQETSKKTGYDLARYLMKDSGINWLMWLLGNHDSWNDGAAVLGEMADGVTQIFDWHAKFQLVMPNGSTCPIWAAHSFKGTSIYNPAHGAMRAALFGQMCPRVLMQGHHHEYHMTEGVYADLDMTYWAGKARGYKFIDDYADKLQFGQNSHGATVVAIIDPEADPQSPGFVRCYPDLEEACDYLTFKRSR